jgi:hypothetical protein
MLSLGDDAMAATEPEPISPSNEPQRVTISLPSDAIAFLKEESARTGSSMADVVRRAIANEKFLQTANSQGADILLSEPGKATMKLVFR